MVTTRSSNKIPPFVSIAQVDSSLDSGDENLGVPPKKKARLKSKAPGIVSRRTKGKLAGLLNLPIDIFAEVTSHLMPLDLLRLARASKLLRSLLMSNSARTLWVASVKNVPSFGGHAFPDCPPDLSEPEYASVVFDKGCMNCASSQAAYVDMSCRIRSCNSCQKTGNNRSPADFARDCNTSKKLTPELGRIRRLMLRTKSLTYFPPNARQVYKRCMVQKARLDPARYAEYLDERLGMMDAIKTHGSNLSAWYLANLQDQEQTRINAGEERRKLIVSKLLEGGWDPQDIPQGNGVRRADVSSSSNNYSLWLKLVYQPKPLTEKGWTTMKPQLETILTFNRSKRLKEEESACSEDLKSLRRKEIQTFYEAFVEEESTEETLGSYPIFLEIQQMACVDILMGQVDLGSPVSADAWGGILDLLRVDIQGYQATYRAHLAKRVRARLNRASNISNGSKEYTEDDEKNRLLLTKDRSRVAFISSRHPDVAMPYPGVLTGDRRWRLAHQNMFPYCFTPAVSTGEMAVVIKDYGQFEMINGVWT